MLVVRLSPTRVASAEAWMLACASMTPVGFGTVSN